MPISHQDLEKIAQQLRGAINQCRDALSIIEGELEPPEVPEDVQRMVDEKLAKRICLAWDHQIPEGDKVIRGNCETDYHTTMARVRRGSESETDLILRGLLTADRKKGGRKAARDKAKALKITDEELAQVAEDVRKYNAKQAKNKGKDDG